LKLKAEWSKNEILTSIKGMEQLFPRESFSKGMDRHRLHADPAGVSGPERPPSIFLARGAKRISSEKIIAALPRTELILYPGWMGGTLSLTCEHHPLPRFLIDSGSSTDVAFYIQGEKTCGGAIFQGRPQTFHLRLEGTGGRLFSKIVIKIRSDSRRKETPHRFKPSNLLIIKDIRYHGAGS
jgi:hypothetical protein